MKYLLFFDIDGTLAIPGSQPSTETANAIRKARAEGNKTFISTGRAEQMVPDFIDAIGFDGGIYSAGGRVIVDGAIISDNTMPDTMLYQALEILQSKNIFYLLECSGASYRSSLDSSFLAAIEQEGANSEMRRMEQEWRDPKQKTLLEYQGEPVYKISFFCMNKQQMDDVETALQPIGKIVRFDNLIPDMTIVAGEISDYNTNKGRALHMVCTYLGASIEQCIAFGDSMNDAEMLQTAGIGIAMGNSEQRVKQLANQVCESCTENGVAKALKRLGII